MAKQIGFVDRARDAFSMEGQIASYMHLVSLLCLFCVDFPFFSNCQLKKLKCSNKFPFAQQPEVVKRDIRFARQLRISSKVKVPFPHSLSVVMRDLHSNSLQMLTQGTADIVLDCCDDFWDGKDLRPLGPQERKRAQVLKIFPICHSIRIFF